MTIKENMNFGEIKIYEEQITLHKLLNVRYTYHLTERIERIKKLKLFSETEINKIFVVNKFHKNGLELHCVLNNGIIIVLNKEKYELYNSGFITILFARPNQVLRLYKECNLKCPSYIIKACQRNIELNYNNI